MATHLFREIESLKRKMLVLGGLVEESLQRAERTILARDIESADQVILADERIDEIEVELEEDCLKALALHQPVASDLRIIIAVLKINNDLERIGDLAVHVAERAIHLAERTAIEFPIDFSGMAKRTRDMLKRSLDALVQQDPDLARSVCAADDEVDEIHRQVYTHVKSGIRERPHEIESLLDFLSVSHSIERVADHATNIAEDVIYTLEGDIVRHGHTSKIPPKNA